MRFGFGKQDNTETHLEFLQCKKQTGLSIEYREWGGNIMVSLLGGPQPIALEFSATSKDEAHILYMQSSEVLRSRAQAGENNETIRAILEKLFASYKR